MRILVTGGAGYIGSHCAHLLESNGITTVSFDNLSHGHPACVPGEFFRGDLLNNSDLDAVFTKSRFDAVMHFAALIEVEESVREPGRYLDHNARGTLNLLEAMRRHNVRKLVFSSTAAVYGDPERTPITEDHPQRPVNPYGLTKVLAERLIDYHVRMHGLRAVSMRYFNAAGREFPYPDPALRAHDTHLITRILNVPGTPGAKVEIFGADYPTRDGTCVRDYVDVRDIAQAHRLALDYLEGGEPNSQFNIGSGEGFTVKEVLEVCRQVTGLPIPAESAPRRAGDPATLVASNDRLRRVLGWRPEHDLRKIVESAWRWHRELAAASTH